VSVAVAYSAPTGIEVPRATIGILNVWDPAAQRNITLQPGVVLHSCRIVRYQPRATYLMEFEVDGRTYRCPLHGFQPRTRVLETAEQGQSETRQAVAV
jgi:hypothetical protein